MNGTEKTYDHYRGLELVALQQYSHVRFRDLCTTLLYTRAMNELYRDNNSRQFCSRKPFIYVRAQLN